MRKYAIAYRGLSVGCHDFSFDIEDSLFSLMGGEDVTGGKGTVTVRLERFSSYLALDVHIEGAVEVVCDRCLDSFMHDVEYDGKLYVKFSSEITTPEYEVSVDGQEVDLLWINSSDDYLDLASYIYESMVLSLPVQRIHPLDEDGNSMCDKDMLARFITVEEQEDAEEEYDDDDDDEDELE